MKKKGYVYILTNISNTVLYTGVTSDLTERMQKHKSGFYKDSFTSRYNITKLFTMNYLKASKMPL